MELVWVRECGVLPSPVRAATCVPVASSLPSALRQLRRGGIQLAGTKTNATVHQPTLRNGRGGSHGSAFLRASRIMRVIQANLVVAHQSLVAGAELDEFLPYQLSMTV